MRRPPRPMTIADLALVVEAGGFARQHDRLAVADLGGSHAQETTVGWPVFSRRASTRCSS